MGAREIFGAYNKEYVFDLATLSLSLADENTPLKGKPLLAKKISEGIKISG